MSITHQAPDEVRPIRPKPIMPSYIGLFVAIVFLLWS